jgi:peptidoglycan hydrolase-like protein with peptidoglycan-binding domain
MIKAIALFTGRSVVNNPGAAAGLIGYLVAFFMVAGNALYGQNGNHPGPLWATRDSMITKAIAKNPERTPRREALDPELLLPKAVPVPALRQRSGQATQSGDDLIKRAQEALAQAGYYKDEVDGQFGPKTRDAIRKFQSEAGMTVNGVVSAELLDNLKKRGERSLETRIEQAIAKSSARNQQHLSAESARSLAEANLSLADVTRAATIARIQIGLINFGESSVVPDGQLNEATEQAIRAFQKQYGLPVTGQPDEVVLRKLESLGVLQQI